MISNILKILMFVLMFIFLELNSNHLISFVLLILLATAYFIIIHKNPNRSFLKGSLYILVTILVFVVIVVLTPPSVKAVPAVSNKNPSKSEIITTNYGKVQGLINEDESVEVFAGIPYAKAPVGDLRWKEPQDIDKWDGVLEAYNFAPMSKQPTSSRLYSNLSHIVGFHDYKFNIFNNYLEPNEEDSLYLNIFKPHKDITNTPVLIYIHGGTLKTGQPWYEDYRGENLAKEDIIVVNFGYRLGVFGFLALDELAEESPNHTTGNYGFLDMIKAITWVKENIEYFGGDPNNITICGESAGAAALSALCVSPLSEGLFNKVILESSTVASKVPPHSYRQYDEAIASGKRLMEKYNVQSIDELRIIDSDKLVEESEIEHYMTNDGYALLKDPYLSYKEGYHHETSIIHGYNGDEATSFLLFSQANKNNYEDRVKAYFGDYADEIIKLYPGDTNQMAKENWKTIYSAYFFSYSHYCLNRLAIENDIDVYEYIFTKKNGRLSDWHSGELIYAFNNLETYPNLFNESDYKLAKTMSSYWLNFIKNGNPNSSDLISWPQNKDNNTLLELGDDIKVVDEKLIKLYEIFDKFYGLK